MYLGIKNYKYIEINDIYSDSKHDYFRVYTVGFFESFKSFNNYGVEIEGFSRSYSVISMGSLDLSYLAEQLDGNEKLEDHVKETIEKIKADLGEAIQKDGK